MPNSSNIIRTNEGRAAERRAFLQLLDEHGIQLTKSLGQNFLYDNQLLDELVEHAFVSENDLVFEVGTGAGSLTAALLKRCTQGFVISCEIDRHLESLLYQRFSKETRLDLRFGDALKLDFSSLLAERRANKTLAQNDLRVAANLPYYLTTDFICKFLCSLTEAKSMAFMVQEEAAERILAKPSDGKAYGPMAVLVHTYGQAKLSKRVPRQAFVPEPHVDSALLVLQKIQDEKEALRHYLQENMALFYRFLNLAFSQRRKTLLNNLKPLGTEKIGLMKEKLNALGLAESVRAEALDWEKLGALFALDILP